jgi:predicted transcriptional regulator
MTRLSMVLEKRKLSQTALAKKMNISQAAVAKMCKSGIKTISSAKSYAAAIGLKRVSSLLEV